MEVSQQMLPISTKLGCLQSPCGKPKIRGTKHDIGLLRLSFLLQAFRLAQVFVWKNQAQARVAAWHFADVKMKYELDAGLEFIILKEAIPLDLQHLNEAAANKDF